MFARVTGVFSLARRHSSRFGRVYPIGAGRRAPRRCRERWLPWSWATKCFFGSGLDESCSFRQSATELSARDSAM